MDNVQEIVSTGEAARPGVPGAADRAAVLAVCIVPEGLSPTRDSRTQLPTGAQSLAGFASVFC